MSDVLLTTCNQFGFKSKLGTDTCIYALKEIVENHRSLDGSMFMDFLDASKAFDRLKHSLLFQRYIFSLDMDRYRWIVPILCV